MWKDWLLNFQLQVDDLGLEDHLLLTSKNSPAAQNRFIYYPDHLVRMPGPGVSLLENVSNVWSQSVFNGTIAGALSEVTRAKRPEGLRDESIGSFISRRFGPALADNIVSAVFHGIYAGDIYKLSARSIVPGLWHTEERYGSIMHGMVDQMMGSLRPISMADADAIALREYDDRPVSEASEAARKSSVFTFKGGIGELADRLEERLKEASNVLIQKGTQVEQIHMTGQGFNSKVSAFSYMSTHCVSCSLSQRVPTHASHRSKLSLKKLDRTRTKPFGTSATSFPPFRAADLPALSQTTSPYFPSSRRKPSRSWS